MTTKKKFYHEPPTWDQPHHPKNFEIRERPAKTDYLSARRTVVALFGPRDEADARSVFPSEHPVGSIWSGIQTSLDSCVNQLNAIIAAYEYPECLLRGLPICPSCAASVPPDGNERISDKEPCSREIPF